ncbi:MAG: type II secretion system F family protein [Armatimonadota bacterium]
MPTFQYRATEKNGQPIEGRLDATDASAVAVELRNRGLLPTRIEKADAAALATLEAPGTAPRSASPTAKVGAPSRIELAPFLNAVPLTDLSAMYRQLATLLHAGVPMLQAVTTLARQTRQPRLRAALEDAAARVSAGQPFSATMEAHPGLFSTMQIELIRAGEMGGMLETMCTRIAAYLERENEIRRKLKRETLYPKIVLVLAFIVTGIVGFAGAGFGQQGLEVVKAKLWFAAMFAGVSLGIWWLVRFLNQLPAFGAAWDYVKMLIPGAGGVSRRYATARFTRALGTLYAAGVFLPRAVEIAGRACGNRAIGQRMVDNSPILMQGGGLTAMLQESGLLDPMAVQMARTGEQTGSLDEMMDKVADYLESDADVKAHQLAVGAGVAALLIAAVVVGIVVISFYSGYMGGIMQTGNG